MKEFSVYQHVEGEPMTERDKLEVGSKFWNEGKWKTFVEPLLPKDCSGLTFVDMGCNAGIFLELAEKKGFSDVYGVDSDKEAVRRAISYRDRIGGNYKILQMEMEKCIDSLPVADVTVLANAHYYFLVGDWIDYLDKLEKKSRYVIIVTAEKSLQVSRALTDTDSIRHYFRRWEEIGTVDNVPLEGDPYPRKLWSFCFKSKLLERVPIESLDNGNHVQDSFYGEIDSGKSPFETRYYRILKKYRKHWSEERLNNFMLSRVELYNSIKSNGLCNPLIVNRGIRVIDGNHRYSILNHLGYKSVIIRRT